MGWGEESLTGLRMASWRLDWCQQRSPHYYALPNLARPVLVGNYGLKLPPAVLRLGSVRRGSSAPEQPEDSSRGNARCCKRAATGQHSTSSLPSTTASGARRPCLLVSSARHRDISTTGDEP
jgi:hypothetical protein